MYKIAETKHFGQTKNPDNRCVLLCQHSDDGENFLRNYPEILERCSASRKALKRYIDLEKDSGSFELSKSIARQIIKVTSGNFEVVIIKSNVPRAIMDTNRVTRFAISNSFNFFENDELKSEFQRLHFDVIKLIREQLFRLLINGGVFVDVHTMAPYSPEVSDDSEIGQSTMTDEFVDLWVNAYVKAPEIGERRYFDLATGYPGCEMADEDLLNFLVFRLKEAGIEFRYDDPYPAVVDCMVGQYMGEYPGISIDVPKDYLTTTSAESDDFDLINPKFDNRKLIEVAHPIALAVLDWQRGF